MDKTKDVSVKKESIDPRVWYLLILPLLLLSILVFAYFFMSEESIEQEKDFEEEVPTEVTRERKLEGEIYLTLSPYTYEDDDFEVKPNIYRFDIATGELQPFFEETYYHNYMASFSPDLEKMTFVKSYGEGKNKVMVLDEDTGDMKALTLLLDFFPRNPKFSPNGASVIYWGGQDLSNPEGSSIYISTLAGVQEEITKGAYPIFSPDGRSIIFLKNDGLYTMNLRTKEEVLAVDLTDGALFPNLNLSGTAWYSFRFNISPDGEYLVITNTLGMNNRILNITSWDDFSYELSSEPDFSQPIWPVFSPCGTYLALEEYRFEDEGESLYLSIYDLETFEIVGGTSIQEYEFDYVWVSDWIIR